MNEVKYGDKYKEHLLEQYKLFVDMSDKLSTRRGHTNMFFITILSILFSLLNIFVENQIFINVYSWEFILVLSLGILLCITWYINISSYKKLNTAKFVIIHEMEKSLPFESFKKEWDEVQKRPAIKKYSELTTIEQFIPFIFIGLFATLLIMPFIVSILTLPIIKPEILILILSNLNK